MRAGGVFRLSAALAVTVAVGAGAMSASAKPILMPTVKQELRQQRALLLTHLIGTAHSTLTLPPPPCPENGLLPSPLGTCGLPELPATTLPWPGNMSYYGGRVQLRPRIYIVYWGWGEAGAWPKGTACHAVRVFRHTLRCDPDGAGSRMAGFVSQLGGTTWAGLQSQYFETDAHGHRRYITNPRHQLAGIWVDDSDPAAVLRGTSADNPGGAKNTYTELAREAARAVRHFHARDLIDTDIVIAQPPNFSDPNALSQGYCAFHDYTQPGVEKGIYNGIRAGIPYTNMPYQLAINSGGANVCGENYVTPGRSGRLDGFSIVLGHEIEETVTDPGAEELTGGAGLARQRFLGGWYDAIDEDENGDKCAWVGTLLDGRGTPNVMPIPGAVGKMRGDRGTIFPVQSLWSNRAAGGLGYCAGAGTDL